MKQLLTNLCIFMRETNGGMILRVVIALALIAGFFLTDKMNIEVLTGILTGILIPTATILEFGEDLHGRNSDSKA